MSREHERLQRLVANEAGMVSAYFAAKQRYMCSPHARHELFEALKQAAPFIVDGEAEIAELRDIDEHWQRVAARRDPKLAPRGADAWASGQLPPSREPPCGPYR